MYRSSAVLFHWSTPQNAVNAPAATTISAIVLLFIQALSRLPTAPNYIVQATAIPSGDAPRMLKRPAQGDENFP